MDPVTRRVQAFYRAYPYPTGIPLDRGAVDCADLLGKERLDAASDGTINVLEAGCGCAQGLIQLARRHPKICFHGVDINPEAIRLAKDAAADISNLYLEQHDLLDPHGIVSPGEGYDLIYSFGVLHHLADPAMGFRRLAELLSDNGRLVCRIYGRYGRQPIQRLIEAITLSADDASSSDHVSMARMLAATASDGLLKDTSWRDLHSMDEGHFVDACMHVHETSYTIESLWADFENAGLAFERWLEPNQWLVNDLIADRSLASRLSGYPVMVQYQVIERLFERPELEIVLRRGAG